MTAILQEILSNHGTRKDIAKKLGVSEALLSQWLTGTEVITEPLLAKIVQEMTVGSHEEKQEKYLQLFLLLAQLRIERSSRREKERWTEDSQRMAFRALEQGVAAVRPSVRKWTGRTLCDFPDSFYPLTIISGDKREDSESRITAGDFGAVSASTAEFRYLTKLGLRHDVEIFGDKIFILENLDELKARFSQRHLLVVGSPGSNHLARRCLLGPPKAGWLPAAAPFRFNLPQFYLNEIEKFLESVRILGAKGLVGKRADDTTEKSMKHWLRYLFAGGIIDPTNTGFWLRGFMIPDTRDFALISLARNPFSAPEDPYMCIMVAGYHLPGTAHALRMLAQPQENFVRHPVGGVLKVLIDTGLPFAKRFDLSTAEWDDPNGYSIVDLKKNLAEMRTTRFPPTLHLTVKDIEESLEFLEHL